jgi:transposase-like protein
MDRDQLKQWLDEGLSLPQIGALTGRDPSTVGYWVQKYGLVANGRDKYAPRGGLTREELEPLIEQCATLEQIASALDVSVSTVRHWLKKFGLRTMNKRRRRPTGDGPAPLVIPDICRHHGEAEFILERLGAYRCKRCRSEAVMKRRRKVKQILVEEAGGACILCGYDRSLAALQFHHLDPSTKAFGLAERGVTRSIEEVRREVEKCILVCSNCHAEIEAGVASLSDALAAAE